MAQLDNFLIQIFHNGNCLQAYKVFGAHVVKEDNIEGVRFTVYAPNAKQVQVVGEFNDWNGENHTMEKYNDGGIYTLFIPGLKDYDMYKYRITTAADTVIDKADPYAFFSELRPGTASKVYNIDGYKWSDSTWMKNRTKNFDKPLIIYEANLGSWKMKKEFTEEEDGEFYSYEEMIDEIIPYVKENGYTHLELMPLNEFPFDGSWGYQATGYFSATSRYGNPKQLMDFINACHKNKIGVIMDFVPAHFVNDAHGLKEFDGGYVYEYPDINKRYTEWGSCYFDFGRDEVRSFLMSAVHFWLEMFHCDGMRFDAISNLIYWKANKELGINDGAIEFMKRLNSKINGEFPGVMLIAEDSTDYPNVTKSTDINGLGFDYKWDLGWMNDTLEYFKKDPIYRQYDDVHNKLTFSMMYFYSEKFILPFSHDEVVHGKATILNKMWGLDGDKFKQTRALYVYMLTHPGKTLNFMGNELAEWKEWDEKKALGWNILEYPAHDAFHRFRKDLNNVVLKHPALYEKDYDPTGFEWLVVDDKQQSVFAYARYGNSPDSIVVTVMNLIGNQHEGYRVPVPKEGTYKELINSEQDIYDGCNFVNGKALKSVKGQVGNKQDYIEVNLAPYSAMVFELHVPKPKAAKKEPAKKEEVKPVKKAEAKPAVKKATTKKAETKKAETKPVAKKTTTKKTTASTKKAAAKPATKAKVVVKK